MYRWTKLHLKQNKRSMHIKANQAVVLDEHTAEDIARAMIEKGNQNEPFFIFDLDQVCRRIEHWKTLMPRIKVFYAMKANDYEWIMKIVIAMGGGFDCASPGEIDKALRLNVPPESIIYAVPNKTPQQMIYAKAAGVRHTTFDTFYELQKLKEYWPEARLLIRIKVASVALYQLGDKFGCDADTEATKLLDIAANMGLKVVGVAFHVGSACSSEESFVIALRHAHSIFQHESKMGRKLLILDIGGGFLSDRDDRINKAATLINKTIDELFPSPEVQIIAEPGRYICDSSMTLYTNISNVKRITEKNLTVYYINEGIYGTLKCSESWHTVQKLQLSSENEDDNLENALLYGPTCDSTDIVMANMEIRLPRCTPNDWLIFKTQGAYTLTFDSVFSSLDRPQIRNVVSSTDWQKLTQLPGIYSDDFTFPIDLSEPLPATLKAPYVQKIKDKHIHTPKLLT